MRLLRRALFAFPMAAVAAVVCCGPAAAQSTELDSLVAPAMQVDTGMALARQQISDGDLLASAATLERVLVYNPSAPAPRLLYASVLCRLDDRRGAEAELRLLAGQPANPSSWSEVTAACGDIAPPAGAASAAEAK